ncbi:MAG TPA: OmpA family protein [Burkholderiales bacterium]
MISRIAVAAALAAISGAAGAQNPSDPAAASGGYVTNSSRQTATGAFGQCVRTGYWNPSLAAEPCDATARASSAPVPMARQEPVPQAAPAPTPIVAEAPRPVIEKVTLSSDVLFEFNQASLRPEGQQKLDELAGRISDANIDEIVATGHADRIASENYNQKLSEERARAVKTYLVGKGLGEQLVKAEGKGESQPVTDCRKMGPERANNRKLVSCLQPDRRVEIEVFGSRETSATGATGSGAGTTGSASGR